MSSPSFEELSSRPDWAGRALTKAFADARMVPPELRWRRRRITNILVDDMFRGQASTTPGSEGINNEVTSGDIQLYLTEREITARHLAGLGTELHQVS
jgi:hypothetical protein